MLTPGLARVVDSEATMMRFCLAVLCILPSLVAKPRIGRAVCCASRRLGGSTRFSHTSIFGLFLRFAQTKRETSDRTGVLFLSEGLAPEFQGCARFMR